VSMSWSRVCWETKPFSRIIGEDITLSIKLGADAGAAGNEDVILVRGISSDVDRAVKAISNIVESAKNDEIINSYVCRVPLLFLIGTNFPSSSPSSKLSGSMLAVSLVRRARALTSFAINLVFVSMSLTRLTTKSSRRRRRNLRTRNLRSRFVLSFPSTSRK